MATVTKEAKEVLPDEEERRQRVAQRPLLSQCYNLMDFEAVARRVMKKAAWGYYSSAADDEIVSISPPCHLRGSSPQAPEEKFRKGTP